MTSIRPTIFHLLVGSNLIERYYWALRTFDEREINLRRDDISSIHNAMFSQILLLTYGFMKEYDDKLKATDIETNQKILLLKNTAKPAATRIRKWNGLKDFRDNVLAHYFRNKGISIFLNGRYGTYNIPNDINELHVMVRCVFFIQVGLKSIFTKECSEYESIILSNLHNESKNKISYDDAIKEAESIEKQIFEKQQELELILKEQIK